MTESRLRLQAEQEEEDCLSAMMTGKSVKDVDRYQTVLNSLLALEENKFCADCESKGELTALYKCLIVSSCLEMSTA